MITVWGRRNSLNVQKAMWAIGELGLESTRHDIGGSFGGNIDAEFDKLNPNRTVPVIDDGGFRLWESNAIVRYLAAKYGQGSLWPEDVVTRASADRWMDWQQNVLYGALGPVFMAICRVPNAEQDSAAIAQHAADTANAFALLEPFLADSDYVAGDVFTMGDIPIGCCLWRYYSLPIERPDLPNLEAYYKRLTERAAFQQHVMFPFGESLEEWTELEQAGAGK